MCIIFPYNRRYQIIIQQSWMKGKKCLGCRTYFEEGEKIIVDVQFNEFKRYDVPLRDNKSKWNLLKLITGFLNSRGGTIYVGVEQKTGQVVGIEFSRKQQDEFLLFIKVFVEKIKPAIDLVNKQQVSIVFVPVVTNNIFKGKYVIKIIVKQGDPSKTYHFNNVISIESRGKTEQFEIFHAYYRDDQGSSLKLAGQPLLEEISRKAAAPNQIFSAFHKFCNPDPLKLDGPITKIGFSNILKEQLGKKLQAIFHNNLQNFDIDYELTFDIENQVLLIELQNQQQCKQINKFIKDNLTVLNGTGQFKFVEYGEYLDFYLYKNQINQSKKIGVNQKEKSREPSPIHQEITKQILPKSPIEVWDYAAGDSDKQEEGGIKLVKTLSKQSYSKFKEIQQKLIGQQPVITITHINTEKTDSLYNQLNHLQGESYKATFEKYTHTIELKFGNKEEAKQFCNILQKNSKQLSEYGVRKNIVIGVNMKIIRISNYDRNKRKQLRSFILAKIGTDSEEVDFKKQSNKFFLQCKFKKRELACIWLERFLADNQIKRFMTPSEDITRPNRLRIYIYCLCI